MTAARRVAGLLVAALLLAGALPGAAYAHARLKRSSPAAGAHLGVVPRVLRLDFSESPDLGFVTVGLARVGGDDVPLGPVAYAPDSRRAIVLPVIPELAAGEYAVAWQAAGDDGHPIRGRFTFFIAPGAARAPVADTGAAAVPTHHDPVSMPAGDAFGAESVGYVVVRWLMFAALLLAVGAVAFRYAVLSERVATDPIAARAARHAARLGTTASALGGLALVLRLGAQSYAMHGAGGALSARLIAPMLASTRWGWGWMVQLAGLALAATGFARAARRVAAWRLAALGAALACASPAMSGHAASAPRLAPLAMLADWVHVVAASGWLGTLAGLLVAGLGAAAGAEPPARAAFVRWLVARFSRLALACAAVVLATGLFSTWLHVGVPANLWRTRYGVLLLVKLAVLSLVSLTGWYNWRRVQPALGSEAAESRLARSGSMEVALAMLVLLVTAVLVATPTSLDAM